MEELATGFGLIEGPVWDGGARLQRRSERRGSTGSVRGGSVETVVEHRRGIGGDRAP